MFYIYYLYSLQEPWKMSITVPKHRWKQFAQQERLRDLPGGYGQRLGKPYNGVGFCDHAHSDFAFSRDTR